MFTNLDFLQVGKQWTPNNATYKKRQENYIQGRLMYEGELESVFEYVWKSIATRYGLNYNDLQQVMIKVNLFKALTETFKILAFKKEPEVWVGEGNKAQRLDKEIYPPKKLLDLLKKAFISCHAQGDGVAKIYTNGEGKPDVSVVNAENWVPVHNPENLDEIDAHVVANVYSVDNSTSVLGINIDNQKKYLYAEIHYRGSYDKKLFELNKHDVITRLVKEENGIKTGYDGFLVFPFNYGTPAWREWGKSAYDDIIGLVDEIIVRLSNNSKILDDHADPQKIISRDMAEFDANTGQWVLKQHQAMYYGKNGEEPKYLTWDGNLDSSEKQLDRILDLFFMLSGTNPQLFGQDIAGNLSGEALAKILIVPIAKTQEMILSLEDAFENALNCLMQMQGRSETIDIKFDIGQFNTPSDTTARVVQEKNAGITSLKRAVEEINPRYTEEEVAQEVEMINQDRQSESMTDINNLFPTDEESETDSEETRNKRGGDKLNGIQVTSIINIANQVASGTLSKNSAIALLYTSFGIEEDEAKAILGL